MKDIKYYLAPGLVLGALLSTVILISLLFYDFLVGLLPILLLATVLGIGLIKLNTKLENPRDKNNSADDLVDYAQNQTVMHKTLTNVKVEDVK